MAAHDWLPSLWNRQPAKARSFTNLRDEIDRTFDDFMRSFGMPMEAGMRGGMMPDMDVHETEKDITLSVELAGVDRKDVDISVDDQTITISGEKKSESEKKDGDYYHTERQYGSFARSLSLPFPIDEKAVVAKFDNGVLTVTITKPAKYETKARKIEIKS